MGAGKKMMIIILVRHDGRHCHETNRKYVMEMDAASPEYGIDNDL